MYSESDLLPLSGLQHLSFCERQWGLIHLEQQWAENRWTAEGRGLHQRVHEPEDELRHGTRICRGLRLRSLELGLIGQADVVEFHASAGSLVPFPVEYKRGRPKANASDEVQLCAQAMCLEEMLGVRVPAGALFYGQPRRRQEVAFDQQLRAITSQLACRMHELFKLRRTPPPEFGPKCRRCSLLQACMPDSAGGGRSAIAYLRRGIRAACAEDQS